MLCFGISQCYVASGQQSPSDTIQTHSGKVTIQELLTLLDKGESIVNKQLVMNEINFDFSSDKLNQEAKQYLDKIVLLLHAIPNMQLGISGHTDNVGSSETNLKLSKQRALSVYHYLIESKVDSTRLSHTGFGDSQPLTSNATKEGRDKNRRVEFSIIQSKSNLENAQLQDVIYFTNGNKIGAHSLFTTKDSLYYYRFRNPNRFGIRLSDVESIHYHDGRHYNKPKEVVEQPTPPSRGRFATKPNSKIFLSGLYGMVGMRTWWLSGKTIDFAFVDDSPSMDNVTNRLDLPRISPTLDIGLEWSTDALPMDFFAGINGHLGKIRGLNFSVGAGYRIINTEKMILRPGLSFMTGSGTVKLGTIENNSLYIQINDQKYYGESVSVKLRKSVNVFQPHVVVDFPKYYLRGQFGVNIQSINSKNQLLFTGDVDGEDVTERKNLASSGSTFKVDGQSQSKLPVNFSGVYLAIGFIIR